MIQINASDTADTLSTLKSQLKSILDLFDPRSKIFYIDYPVYTNIGDLLINIGTEQFFLDYKIPIFRRYSVLNMPHLFNFKVDENTTFLCQGGGNFGDLYSEHQGMREWLVNKFPHARIIFLPQSLYYSSQEKQRVSLEKFARHHNLHILARDRESLDMLRHFNISRSSMMPDMAHQLWGILSPISSLEHGHDIYFLRRDKEATSVPVELTEKFAHHPVDWDDIISAPHMALVRSAYHLLKTGGRILPASTSVSIWYSTRDKMIRDAVAYFSRYERVYTNRLHALLLALLLGRDVFTFDNSYGKLSRYIKTWLRQVAVMQK